MEKDLTRAAQATLYTVPFYHSMARVHLYQLICMEHYAE